MAKKFAESDKESGFHKNKKREANEFSRPTMFGSVKVIAMISSGA